MDRAREPPHHLQLFSRQPGIIGILRRRHQESESSESQDPVSTIHKLAVSIIPLSCSRLVWKRILLCMWSLRGSQQPFSWVLGHFRHGDTQTNDHTTRWSLCKPALDQWEGSLLQNSSTIALLHMLLQILSPSAGGPSSTWLFCSFVVS